MPTQDARVLAGGRYRLLEPLGQGGMGTVWKALDTALGRHVAVKEVRLPGELDADAAEVFHRRALREAQAAARLRHPSIIDVYDVLQEDGRPWIVMELVDGRNLAQLVAGDGPMPPQRAAEIGGAVAAALRAAHLAGVLHRDVKPANVILAANGRVVLTDFGIATFEGATTLTASGTVLGSVDHMAPEVARGEDATAASDLWSLGTTLYTLVEGSPPYRRATRIATLGAILTEEPPQPGGAGALAPVLKALLRRDPARRSGHDETERLLRAAARTVVPGTRSSRRSKPLLVVGAALVAVAVALGGWALLPSESPPDSSPKPRATSPAPSTPAPSTPAPSTPVPSTPAVAGSDIPLKVRMLRPSMVIVRDASTEEVLYQGQLEKGKERLFDRAPLDIVVSDGTAVEVRIYGVVQPKVTGRGDWHVPQR